MSNVIDIVFSTIKEHCGTGKVADPTCLESIKRKLHSEEQQNSVDIYLGFLQDLQLIRFSEKEHSITLTDRGKYTNSLFG